MRRRRRDAILDPAFFADRLARQSVGATAGEIAALRSSFVTLAVPAQQALADRVASHSDSEVRTWLVQWRAGNPFGGVLPFVQAAVLTGVAADDAYALSAGTGLKLSPMSRWCRATFPTITLNTANGWLWTPGASDMSIALQSAANDYSVVNDGTGSQYLRSAKGGAFMAATRLLAVMSTLDGGSALTRYLEYSMSFQAGLASGFNQNGSDAVMALGTDGRTTMWGGSPCLIAPNGNLFDVAGDLFVYMQNGHLTDVCSLTMDIYVWNLL